MTATRFALLSAVLSMLGTGCTPPPRLDTLSSQEPIRPPFPDSGTIDANGRRVRVECPNIRALEPRGRGSAAAHDSTIRPERVGAQVVIPEYHDCQRLIVGGARGAVDSFGSLVGIFAVEALGAIRPAEFRRPGGALVAQLYNFSSRRYAVLNIEPGYNCLYLKLLSDTVWQAHLTSRGSSNDCPELASMPRGPLRVTRSTPFSYDTAYPPVARWDWDPVHRRNYMGIKCLTGWCEIGIGPFAASPIYSGSAQEVVKGWYDEQALAVPRSGVLSPRVRGRIVPAARLDTLTKTHFSCPAPCTPRQGWVRVATVHLDATPDSPHYRTKMNFTPGVNQIFIRMKVRQNEEVWQARIISAAGDTAYRRTLRVDHGTHPVPATARWHWREDDERTWTRCAIGCCESGSDVISPDDWS